MVMMGNKEANDELLSPLPPLPGTYALVLRVSRRLEILVGRLDKLEVQPGFYVYVGSALGPGGLAARVGRHCRCEKRLRWHVDYLRAVAKIEAVWYATGRSDRECQWAMVLQDLPGAAIPLAGFGSSDCGCPAHLFFFSRRPSFAACARRLRGPRLKHFQALTTPAAIEIAGRR